MKRVKVVITIFLLLFCLNGCMAKQPEESVGFLEEYTAEAKEGAPLTERTAAFTVHYIDVGQADAALIRCRNTDMLIDGGNREDSSLIAAYLKKCGIDYLDYVICSHADEDHVGGLSGALSVATAGTIYAPETEDDTEAYLNFKKKVKQQGLTIVHPKHGDSFLLGESTVQVLAPVREDYGDKNNTSIVVKITYGATSFLFTGDAETEAEQDMLSQDCDLSATVLKVSHHGSADSTSYAFLREVMPKYAVISVGENNYGHPTETVLSRLRDADVTVYRTDLQGDIIVTSDGKTLSFNTSKNANIDTLEAAHKSVASFYIGNKNSKKFHAPSCDFLPSEKNRVYFSSREEAVKGKYSPCGNCNP